VGTTLTPEFWRLFAVLLVSAMAVTFVLSAALDALVLRTRRRHSDGPPPATRAPDASRRPARTLVGH